MPKGLLDETKSTARPPKASTRSESLFSGQFRALAHAIQEKAFGGLSPTLRQRLQRFAAELKNTGRVASIGRQPNFKPGTRLVREWQRCTHEVTVLEEGFRPSSGRMPGGRSFAVANPARSNTSLIVRAVTNATSHAISSLLSLPQTLRKL